MMSTAVTFGGWFVAGLAGLVAVVVWRLLELRMESVARASHELRGPLAAARLGLEVSPGKEELSLQRLRAVDLELERAALALDDLVRAGRRTPRARARNRTSRARARNPRSSAPACNPRSPAPADNPRYSALGDNQTRLAQATPTFGMRELMADSVEARRASADAAGARLRLHWVGADARIRGDRVRLAQAMGNLIANAIEHGGETIDVYGRAELGKVCLEVVDNGGGLPAPVAELTQRARGGRGQRGRGLAIATAIVEGHGGRIAAAPVRHGARLIVELPLAEPLRSVCGADLRNCAAGVPACGDWQ